MLPSPDKSSTKNSFCFYHDPRSRVKSQPNAYFLQRLRAGIFQKMAIAQPVVIFQACCFAEKNSPYT
jgi:hypothetical protein